jgi:hypothetical protein
MSNPKDKNPIASFYAQSISKRTKDFIEKRAIERGTFIPGLREFSSQELLDELYIVKRGGAQFSGLPEFDVENLSQQDINRVRTLENEINRLRREGENSNIDIIQLKKDVNSFVNKIIKIPPQAKRLMQNSNKLRGKLKSGYTLLKIFILLGMVEPNQLVDVVDTVIKQVASNTQSFVENIINYVGDAVIDIKEDDEIDFENKSPEDIKININPPDPPDDDDDDEDNDGDDDDDDDDIPPPDIKKFTFDFINFVLKAVLTYYGAKTVGKIEKTRENVIEMIRQYILSVQNRNTLNDKDKTILKNIFKKIRSNEKENPELENYLKEEIKSNERLHAFSQSFTGAGTRIVSKILQKEFAYPQSKMDTVAMLHDMFYISKDPKIRQFADINFMKDSEEFVGDGEIDVARFFINLKINLEGIIGNLDFFGADLSGQKEFLGTARKEDVDNIFKIHKKYLEFYDKIGLKIENDGVTLSSPNIDIGDEEFKEFREIEDLFKNVLTGPSFIQKVTITEPGDEKNINTTNISDMGSVKFGNNDLTNMSSINFEDKLDNLNANSNIDRDFINDVVLNGLGKAEIIISLKKLGFTRKDALSKKTKAQLMNLFVSYHNDNLKEGQRKIAPNLKISKKNLFQEGEPISTMDDATSSIDDAPTTDAPTTDAPTMDAPTTNAPTTDAPTTDAPTTDAPTTDAPTENKTQTPDNLENAIRDLINVIKISTEDIEDDTKEAGGQQMNDQVESFDNLAFSANNQNSKEEVDGVIPSKKNQEQSNDMVGLTNVVVSSLWRTIDASTNQDRIIKKRMEYGGTLNTGYISGNNVKSNYKGLSVAMRDNAYNRNMYMDKYQGTDSALTTSLQLIQSRKDFFNNKRFNPDGAPWRFANTRKIAI